VEKICPICGRSSKEVEFVGEFCKDCYLKYSKQNIPNYVEIKKCKKCGKIKVGKEWFDETKEKLEEVISKGIKLKFELKEVKNDTAFGFVFIDNTKIETSIKLKFIKTLCDEDFLKTSRYYEAKLQLRGSADKVEQIAQMIEKNLQNTYILEKRKEKNGVDLLIGSRGEVEKIIKKIGLQAQRTFSLVGMKNGKRFYRATYIVRCGDDKAQDNNN